MTALGTIVSRRRLALGVAAFTIAAVAACGGDDETAAPATTTTAPRATTTAPVPTSSTTSTTLPESGPVTLRSPHYRYTLTVDVERLKGRFDPADNAWDGETRVVRGSLTDLVPVSGGDVFFVGLPWTGDLASFAQMFVDHAAERNSCSQGKGQRPVTVADSPALLFTVDSCGNENVAFVRVALVRDGFGLIAFEEAVAGNESPYADHLLSVLAGLSWAAPPG